MNGPSLADLEIFVAVCESRGVEFMSEADLQEALQCRRLLPVLPNWWPGFSGPFLYDPSRIRNPPALRAFLDFIRAA